MTKATFNKIAKAALLSTALLGTTFLGACSDANRAAFSNLGQEAKVKVYSGGHLIYEGVASGKIENESGSDGYYFNDKCIKGKNDLAEVAGQLVITRDDLTCPEVREPVYQAMKKVAAPAPQ